LILISLADFAATNIGFLLVTSTTGFIIVGLLEGSLTAGHFPAAMGVVADVVTENERAKWVGMVMGNYGDSLIVLGGLHHDYHWRNRIDPLSLALPERS
jgi:MFS family permease